MLKGLRYGRRFYSRQSGGSRSSADVILPIVFDLVHPRSVVDVGCGVGTWLSAAHQLGAGTIIGYDGHHVQDNMMVDNAIRFRQVDLAADPWEIRDKVDLAMSLEVAEHVPPEAGERIVEQLCRGAPVVLFGAAIPGQLGRGHINEHWQSYWVAAFARRGYAAYDVVRTATWDDERVDPWYAQNTFLYVDTRHDGTLDLRVRLAGKAVDRTADAVNPRLWRDRVLEPTLLVWLRYGWRRLRASQVGRSKGISGITAPSPSP